jgi:GNAT superfamily N-acetyltransferase
MDAVARVAHVYGMIPATAPTLSSGYHLVPAGHMASVVTRLEMHERPSGVAATSRSPAAALRRLRGADMPAYRRLFAEVGTPWLWFSRLAMDDESLRDILDDAAVQAFAVDVPDADATSSRAIGLLELDFRTPGQCELAFLGMQAPHTGRGLGRWLMTEALRMAWDTPSVRCVHVHTCTLDHPSALGFYLRAGFKAVGRAIEIAPDPRALGLLPADAAPDVPLITV